MELSLDHGVKLTAQTDLKEGQSRPLQKSAARVDPCFWIIGAALVAFVIKLAIALNTFGTNDVAAFYIFARSLHDHGLQWTYQNGVAWSANYPVFNHPPLTAYYLECIEALSRFEFCREHAFTFPFLLRLPGIVADLGIVLVVLRIVKTTNELSVPFWALVLFALSPVSLMVSGFHGNTDTVMVMFLVIAAYMSLRRRPLLCGLFFALSCQVKIIPLLLLPIFFFFWLNRRAAVRFTVPFMLLSVMLWGQALVNFPMLFVRNVLAYGSYWGTWGITYWLQLTRWSQFNAVGFLNLPPAAAVVALVLKGTIIAAVLMIGWRRRSLGATGMIFSIAYAWIIFFVFSPGFCAYYLIWLTPFILLLSPAFYASLTATSSLFLFIFYNGLAGGLPWFITVSKFSNPDRFNWLTPWSLWPWATLVCGMILFWKKAVTTDPSLRWFSLKTLPSPGA
jgi:uncharacterized membrane protein